MKTCKSTNNNTVCIKFDIEKNFRIQKEKLKSLKWEEIFEIEKKNEKFGMGENF